MTKGKIEGEMAITLGLQKRFPGIGQEETELIAAHIINFMADHIADGWTPALVKTGKKGLPKQIRVFELKGVDDTTQSPFEAFFIPAVIPPTRRKK